MRVVIDPICSPLGCKASCATTALDLPDPCVCCSTRLPCGDTGTAFLGQSREQATAIGARGSIINLPDFPNLHPFASPIASNTSPLHVRSSDSRASFSPQPRQNTSPSIPAPEFFLCDAHNNSTCFINTTVVPSRRFFNILALIVVVSCLLSAAVHVPSFSFHNTLLLSDVIRNRTTTGDGKRRPVSLLPP